jgi:hypothetical protein
MRRELATQRAFNQGFLEATDGGVELLWTYRSIANELIQNLCGNRCRGSFRTRVLRRGRGITVPPCYALHTEFLTPS